MRWLKKENAVGSKVDDEQFGEGEYRLAVSARDVSPVGEFKFTSGEQVVSVNGDEFEYAEGEGLESCWQIAENKASFALYSKVYKLNGVEYWTNIFTKAGADEYADALDLETAMDYNNDPEFAGKTDEERIEVIKCWLADAEREEQVTLEGDSPIYYEIADETDAGGNSIKVLHLGSTPYAGGGEYSLASVDLDERNTIDKIVIDNQITLVDSNVCSITHFLGLDFKASYNKAYLCKMLAILLNLMIYANILLILCLWRYII